MENLLAHRDLHLFLEKGSIGPVATWGVHHVQPPVYTCFRTTASYPYDPKREGKGACGFSIGQWLKSFLDQS